jgi:hypothetical protein
MRNYAILLIASFSLIACKTSQTPVSFDKPFIKTFDELPHMKDELFIKSMDFLIVRYENEGSIIKYSDKDTGVILCELNMGSVEGKFEIRVKDHKAAILLMPYSGWFREVYKTIGTTYIDGATKDQLIARMEELAEKYRLFVSTPILEF